MENPFILGGLIAAALGVAATASKVAGRAWQGIQRFVCTTVDVADQDDAFYWLQTWLGAHPYSQRARLLTATSRKRHSAPAAFEDPGALPTVTFSPAPGVHVLRHRGRWLLLTRARKDVNNSDTFAFRETFTIRAFTRDRNYVRELLHEARDLTMTPPDARLTIHSPTRYGEWRVATRRAPRPVDSVILDDDLTRRVLTDATRFLCDGSWYREVGVPHRRGYLLHGPPGNGKSSLVLAVASALGYNLATVGLMAQDLTDSTLHGLLADLPSRTIVLMEDVDAAFHGRKAAADQKLTFAGLLNTLDGVASAEGRILFMTTNHIEHLDPAFIRPGRVDWQVFIGNATRSQAQQIYLRFFPGEDKLAARFARTVREGTVPMAALQNHLLAHRDDARAAAARRPDPRPRAA